MFGRIKNRYFGALKARKNPMANQDGNVIVEMALSLPVLLLLFTGIVSFAGAYSNQMTLTQAVGIGGEYLQQLRGNTTNPCASVIGAIENAAPYLTASSISLTLTMDGTTASGNSCPGDQQYLVQGTPVTVLATYPCVLSAYSMKFTGTCQLSAEVTEYEY
jgi:Flp pilus assembly protein TadG